MKIEDDPRIIEARAQAISQARELCPLGGQWGNTLLRDDGLVWLCGERRLSAVDWQGFTITVRPGTNETHYWLDS